MIKVFWGDLPTGKLSRLPFMGYSLLLYIFVTAHFAGLILFYRPVLTSPKLLPAETAIAQWTALMISILVLTPLLFAQINLIAKRLRDIGLPAIEPQVNLLIFLMLVISVGSTSGQLFHKAFVTASQIIALLSVLLSILFIYFSPSNLFKKIHNGKKPHRPPINTDKIEGSNTMIRNLFGDIWLGKLTRLPYLGYLLLLLPVGIIVSLCVFIGMEIIEEALHIEAKEIFEDVTPLTLIALIICAGPFIFAHYNITAKRLRDIGLPGWWTQVIYTAALFLFPFILSNLHLAIVELSFLLALLLIPTAFLKKE